MRATVLIVDDDPDACDLLAFVLKHEGYMVLCAEDGQEALGIVRQIRVDLIVSDIVMPNVNGLELIKILHSDPDLSHIPVLVVTGQHRQGIAEALKAGAAGGLTKPLPLRPLLRLIEITLEPA